MVVVVVVVMVVSVADGTYGVRERVGTNTDDDLLVLVE